ncbi:MAG: hypothetical protein U1E30_03230 [Rhodoblastus sp.]
MARGNSIVGSIGVLMQAERVQAQVGSSPVEDGGGQILAAQGRAIRSSRSRRKARAADRRHDRRFAWFRRSFGDLGWTMRVWRACPTGACSPAARASSSRLVDRIGGEREAVAWLEAEKGVAKGLKVRTGRSRARSRPSGPRRAGEQPASTVWRLCSACWPISTATRLLDEVCCWQGSALN